MLDPDPNTDNHAHMNIWCKIFTIGSLQTGKHLELPQNNLPKM